MREGTVLLTGATGFVGKNVFDLLVQQYNIRVVIRRTNTSIFEKYSNVEVVYSTDIFLESEEWWKDTCKNVDFIIHCAWYAEPGLYLDSELNLKCLIGTINFANAARKNNVKKFVGIGTCFEYDLSNKILSIDSPINPTTLYASAKASAFFTLRELFKNSNTSFSWCRLFYLYGKGEDSRRLVPYIRNQIAKGEKADLTSGLQVRDYLNIEKAAEMIIEILVSTSIGPLNICSGVGITVKELAEEIASEYGRLDLLNFGSRAENLLDPPCVIGVKSIP
jgi:dTDP-6-deoxy-L-talose 4-dehydrogenase (NAD+)